MKAFFKVFAAGLAFFLLAGAVVAMAEPPPPDLQSTPGDPVPMPKNYWSPDNSSGAIAFTVDGRIQSFVFISTDGKRMVLSAEVVAKNERAHTLLMAIMDAGHLDNVSYKSGCTTVEDERKLEKLANPTPEQLEGPLTEDGK